jgi:single-stranded DNA-binding protein
MQTMGVTGKIYGLKPGQTGNGKDKVSFRVGVRKQYVTDQDKQDGKTLTFIPMIAMGPTAKFIMDYFNDGDGIAVGSMEYQTYRTQNAPNEFDDAHIFKVNQVGFVGDNSGGGNGGGNARQTNNRQSNNRNTNQRANNTNTRNQRQTVPADDNNIDNSYQSDDDLPF